MGRAVEENEIRGCHDDVNRSSGKELRVKKGGKKEERKEWGLGKRKERE